MPSEPIEAEFISPPALLSAQEDDFRILHSEGPPTRQSSPDTAVAHCHDVKLKEYEGYHIVGFDKGTREDPREMSLARKWFITVATSFLCLAVAVGSSIVTGDMVGPTKTLHIQQTITNLTVTCFVMGFGLGHVSFSYHLPSFDSFQTSLPCTTIGSLWPSSHLLHQHLPLLHLHVTKRAGEERCYPRCRTYDCRALRISTHMQRRRHHRRRLGC